MEAPEMLLAAVNQEYQIDVTLNNEGIDNVSAVSGTVTLPAGLEIIEGEDGKFIRSERAQSPLGFKILLLRTLQLPLKLISVIQRIEQCPIQIPYNCPDFPHSLSILSEILLNLNVFRLSLQDCQKPHVCLFRRRFLIH
jgi:hypothetical protein